MIIRLRGELSGTRNGQEWPPRGSVIELPDDEAAALCQNGMAVPVSADAVEMAVIPEDEIEHRGLTTDDAPTLGRRKRA